MTDQEEAQNAIIRATNSQTAVGLATLRATDPLHRSIEDVCKSQGIFYDRRKNFYKNQGKSRANILTVTEMAQYSISVLLGRPNDARARPNSLLKKDKDYALVFSNSYPIKMYLQLAMTLLRIRKVIGGCSALEKRNIRFYVAMHVYWSILGADPSPEAVANLADLKLTDESLNKSLDLVRKAFKKAGGADQTAKSSGFAETIKKSASSVHSRRKIRR